MGKGHPQRPPRSHAGLSLRGIEFSDRYPQKFVALSCKGHGGRVRVSEKGAAYHRDPKET